MKAILIATLSISVMITAGFADETNKVHGPSVGHHPIIAAPSVPKEPGQSAFAAIQEIVSLLKADPATDWSKVDIEALRQHLIDMNNVTLGAKAEAKLIPGGMTYTVTGNADITGSIQRMIAAHAAAMQGVEGRRFQAEMTENGANLMVQAPNEAATKKLWALGFIGILTQGVHHQEHHLRIAKGSGPHH